MNVPIRIFLAFFLVFFGAAGCGNAESSRIQETKHRLEVVSSALQAIYVDIGRFPTLTEGLEAVFGLERSVSGWKGPYSEDDRILKDSWGNEFVYDLQASSNCFQLYSFGPNGVDDGRSGDDIISDVICTDDAE